MSCICFDVDNKSELQMKDIIFKLEKTKMSQKEIDEMTSNIKKSLEKSGLPPVIGKDLPRLVNKMQIKDEKLEGVTSPIVQLLLNLNILLHKDKKLLDVKTIQEAYDNEVKSTDYETLNSFILKYFSEDNFIIQILKSTTQATLARPIILLKQLFQEQNLEFKDEEWKIDVTSSDEFVNVIHKRTERVDVQPDSPELEVFFKFSWKLIISYHLETQALSKLKIVFNEYQYYEKARRGANKNGRTEDQVKNLLESVFDFVKDEILFK